MTFEEIYNCTIEKWPREIDISDGIPTNGDGYYFKNLSRLLSEIESNIDYENDHWSSIATWSFFQAIHKTATKLHQSGTSDLVAADVSKAMINEYILKNLQGEEWEKERNEYEEL